MTSIIFYAEHIEPSFFFVTLEVGGLIDRLG